MAIRGKERLVSPFSNLQHDMRFVVDKLLKNNNLCKLLEYNVPNALSMPVLTQEQKLGLVKNNFKFSAKIEVEDVKTYIIITFDDFWMNETNPQFRDCSLVFDVITHHDIEVLEDYQLRSTAIITEIDTIFHDSKMRGIGTTQFQRAERLVLNNNLTGMSINYAVMYHPLEDNK